MHLTKEIVELYLKGNGAPTIALHLNIKIGKVYWVLKQNKVPLRSHKLKNTKQRTCNEQFFSQIDTQEKAYIVGLIAADGAILKTQQASSIIKLDLHSKDMDILYKIKEVIQYTGPIKFYKSKTSYGEGEIARLLLISDTLVQDLSLIGISERKSHTLGNILKFIPLSLQVHYIRGYFDGDGSWKGNREDIAWSIMGTENTCLGIANLMTELGIVKIIPKLQKRHEYDVVKTLEYGGRKQCKRIGNWMYKDATIFLDRKFDKYKTQLCLTD